MELVIDGKIVRQSTIYPNYGVTKYGEAFNINTKRKMKISLHGGNVHKNDNYLCFRVSHNGKPENAYLHKVVAECWVYNDDPVNKVQVNHKDGNKRNPIYTNLEWVTRSQNIRHAVSLNLIKKGEDLYNAGLTNDQVHQVCQRLSDGARVCDVADVFNVSNDIITKIKSGDSYPHIRVLYDIDTNCRKSLSESTVRWVCERINDGLSNIEISKLSHNKKVSKFDVNRIRYKARYKLISDEYF